MIIRLCFDLTQDGRADVVANDAGDRVTPAVVAYRETEQVRKIIIIIINIPLHLLTHPSLCKTATLSALKEHQDQ